MHAEQVEQWIEEVALPAWTTAALEENDLRSRLEQRRWRHAAERLLVLGGDSFSLDEVTLIDALSPRERLSLARGLRAFSKGHQALKRYDFEDARMAFAQSLMALRTAGSPRAWWAEAEIAHSDFQLGSNHSAHLGAERTKAVAQSAGYLRLHGRAASILANIHLARLDLERALSAAREANHLSRRTGSRRLTATTNLTLGRIFGELGDPEAAWLHQVAALRELNAIGDEERLALTIGNISFALSRERYYSAATDFASEMLAFDRRQGTPLGLTESLWIRATHRTSAGDRAGAIADVKEAESYLPGISSVGTRARLLASLRVTEGAILAGEAPRLAIVRLTEGLDFLRRHGYEYGQAEALLERARCERRLGQADKAIADLNEAARLVEAQRGKIERPLLRVSFFDLQAELQDERVALAAKTLDPARVFWVADRAKGLLFREALGIPANDESVLSPVSPMLSIGGKDAVIAYWSLPETLLIWVVRGGERPRMVQLPLGREKLESRISRFVRALAEGHSPVMIGDHSEFLYRYLIYPIAADLAHVNRLVIVPDRIVRAVPWPALQEDATKEPLATRFIVRICPTASALLARPGEESRPARIEAESTLVAIGDPYPASVKATSLSSLAGARREVSIVAQFFTNSTLLTGARATRGQLLRALEEAAIFHAATHFVAGKDPWSTQMVLAEGKLGMPSVLQAKDIARLRLPRLRLAVLSSCATGREERASIEGTFSAAGAFLAAGAYEVVASLWPVNDWDTTYLMKSFYQELLAGHEADEALRSAQLRMRTPLSGAGSRPRSWAAFQIISLHPAE